MKTGVDQLIVDTELNPVGALDQRARKIAVAQLRVGPRGKRDDKIECVRRARAPMQRGTQPCRGSKLQAL